MSFYNDLSKWNNFLNIDREMQSHIIGTYFGNIEVGLLTAGAMSQVVAPKSVMADWVRWGKTKIPNQLIHGPGTPGITESWAIKGGGINPITKIKMPFHYHIHRFNWHRPWTWFKYTPTAKPPKP